MADWSRGAAIVLLVGAGAELLDSRPGWSGGKTNAPGVGALLPSASLPPEAPGWERNGDRRRLADVPALGLGPRGRAGRAGVGYEVGEKPGWRRAARVPDESRSLTARVSGIPTPG